MFKVDDQQFEKYLRRLDGFPKAVQFAERNTLNDLAFEGKKATTKQIRENFTIRNTWTRRSIRISRARYPGDPAVLGSTEEYMARQEFGGSKGKTGREGVPIPTNYAAGQTIGQGTRKKAVTERNRLDKIRLAGRTVRGKSKRQTNFLRVLEAIRSGQKEIFMDLGRRQGIFRVLGGARGARNARGGASGARVRMIYDMTRSTVTTQADPWLAPATAKAVEKRGQFWQARLRQQVNMQLRGMARVR